MSVCVCVEVDQTAGVSCGSFAVADGHGVLWCAEVKLKTPAAAAAALTDVFWPGLCRWHMASIRATFCCWPNVAPLT